MADAGLGGAIVSTINTPVGAAATTGIGAGLLAVGITAVTFGGIYAHSKIGDYFIEYKDEELKQIGALQDLFKEYCFPLEKTETPLSNIESDEDRKQQYPSFFVIKKEKRKGLFHDKIYVPLLWKEKFAPMFDAKKWIIKCNKGELKSMIAEMLAYICQYQTERGDDTKHSYSPLHLFFEEFKCWLLKLSTINIADVNYKNIVEQRILYLQAVRNYHDLFNNKMYLFGLSNKAIEPTPNQTLMSLFLKLNTIKDKMILAISRRSAREHFSDLKINIEHVLYTSVNYILHLFANRKLPKNFILTEIKIPTIPSYKKLGKTFLCRIVSAFVNTSAYSLVFNLDYFKYELTKFLVEKEEEDDPYDLSKKTFSLEHFIGMGNEILIPEIVDRMNEINKDKKEHEKLKWYEVKDEANIYTEFANEESIECLCKLLGWLQKMCFFYKISDSLFELAGEGGNLLVYGKAAGRVQTAIASFSEVYEKTIIYFNLLKSAAQHHKDFIDALPNDERLSHNVGQRKAWLINFSKAQYEFPNIEKSLVEMGKNIKEINLKLAEVNTVAYQIKVAKQLAFFNSLVNEFCNIIHPNEELSDSNSNDIALLEEGTFDKFLTIDGNGYKHNYYNNNNVKALTDKPYNSSRKNSIEQEQGGRRISNNFKLQQQQQQQNKAKVFNIQTEEAVEVYMAYGENPNKSKKNRK